MWDVTYEHLRMHDVRTEITLNQFYFAPKHPPPSTMYFDNITFRDIEVTHSDARGESETVDVDFNCDTHYNGRANCLVTMEDLRFAKGARMSCEGVTGFVRNVDGISNCVKPPTT